MNTPDLLNAITRIAVDAGAEIARIYESDFEIGRASCRERVS
jgi:hypothetical protein